jgi:hypothetical protein
VAGLLQLSAHVAVVAGGGGGGGETRCVCEGEGGREGGGEADFLVKMLHLTCAAQEAAENPADSTP